MNTILKALSSVANTVLDFLPNSPFREFIDKLGDIPYLGYLNYFVPVSDFVVLLTLWTVAIGFFYVVSAVLRTINMID